ncbi:hypothetical protein E4U23_001535 [Claviceps purpurea]|nr:hypothetical protein E4U23_001535 [Claviceps purpurea]
MPRMSTRSSTAQSAPARGRATRSRRNAPGQDPNPSGLPPLPPAPPSGTGR